MNVINVDKNNKNIPVRIFKNDKGKYSVSISKKVGDKYETRYYPVEFTKDISLDNKTDIIIKNAILSWYDWTFEDKKDTKFLIKVLDFEKVGEVTPQNIDKWNAGKNIEIQPDELPFF